MTTSFLLNGVPYVVCQGCGEASPACNYPMDAIPVTGLEVTLRGWYGGFSDTLPGEEPQSLIICHGCALRVYRALPELASKRGLHSTVDDEVCCEFHWTFGLDESGEIETIEYGDGTSRPITPRKDRP